jgi:hypothetical protein
VINKPMKEEERDNKVQKATDPIFYHPNLNPISQTKRRYEIREGGTCKTED